MNSEKFKEMEVKILENPYVDRTTINFSEISGRIEPPLLIAGYGRGLSLNLMSRILILLILVLLSKISFCLVLVLVLLLVLVIPFQYFCLNLS